MPVTTLNKVIALFLVGGVVAFLATGLHWEQVYPLSSSATNDSGFWIFFAFLLLPVSALMGAIVEGLSQVTLQNFLKRARSSKAVAKLFGQRRAHECLNKWQDHLATLVTKDSIYQWLAPVDDADKPWALRSTAADFLLQSARPGKLEWLVQHYATFVLASNLACVIALAVIYVLVGNLAAAFGVWWPVLAWATTAQIIALLATAVFAFWALCSLSISRYLYSHELSARHMSLCLSDERLLKIGDQ